MNKLKIIVVKSPFRTYGYSLQHNQSVGWRGTLTNVYAWYKYKSDAIKTANQIMIEVNKCTHDILNPQQ